MLTTGVVMPTGAHLCAVIAHHDIPNAGISIRIAMLLRRVVTCDYARPGQEGFEAVRFFMSDHVWRRVIDAAQ